MKQESRRSSDHSNKDIGEDDSKKSQAGDQSLGLKITKMLARDREKLQDKGAIAAVPSKDTADGVYSSLVRHGFLDKKAQIIKTYSDAKDLMWQAERLVHRSLDPTLDPEISKLLTSFIKAYDPFKKIEQYKDKSTWSLMLSNVEEPINTLKEALESIKESKLVPKLPAGVSHKEDGSYDIDLSAFEPADLAKLDLSRPDEFTFYVSDKRKSKCSYPFPISKEWKLQSLRYLQEVLETGYSFFVTNTYSQDDVALYKDVLKLYATFNLYCTLDKTNLNTDNFENWWREGAKKITSLVERNEELIPFEKISDINSSKVVDKLQEKQDDNSTSRFLFSDKEIERALADEMIVSHAYHDLWAKYKLPRSDIEGFETDYAIVQRIVETRIRNIKPEDREGFLNSMREVNQSLKKTAEALAKGMLPKGDKDSAKGDIKEEDLNQLQLALRDAIVEVRQANQWTKENWPNCTKWFDLKDTWVDVERRGLKKEHIEESCTRHQDNVHVHQIISDAREAAKVAYNYAPSEVVETYEKLIRANAPLKYICDQFGPGVPAKFKPDCINGRDILVTPGKSMNCLIYSLIKVSQPEKQWDKIEKEATRIRKILKKDKLANHNDLLDLTGPAGKRVIKELTDKGWFNLSRGLVVYQLATVDSQSPGPSEQSHRREIQGVDLAGSSREMRVYWNEVLPRTEQNSDKPEYALFVSGETHFEAMSEPKEE